MNDSNLTLSQKLKKKILEQVAVSTWAGLPNIVNSDNLLQKLLWLIVMLLMMAYASFSIASNVLEYQEHPVVTNINSVYKSEPQFPAVRLCYFDRRYPINLNCYFEGTFCKPINILYYNDNCDSFNEGLKRNISDYPIDILTSKVAGKNNGLTLHLTPKKGRQIETYLFNQSTNMDLKKEIYISSGMETNLVVSRVFRNKLSLPFSDCKKDYSFNLGPLDIIN